MKKAKMVLTAIVLFSITGTALAFKANKVNPNLYYCDANNKCQLSNFSDLDGSQTTVNLAVLFKTGVVGQPCTITCTNNPTTAKFNN